MKIMSIDIGGTAIKFAVFDENAQLLETGEESYDNRLGGQKVLEITRTILRARPGFSAIGVSATGQVDARRGEIIGGTGSIPGYVGLKLRELLETEFSVPVTVQNDVNAAALGEAHFGAGKGFPDFLCLTYGTGVGGAIILNGEVFIGTGGVAGEFGHMLTHTGGKRCPCGHNGCYEAYASTTALVRLVREQFPDCKNGREIFARMEKEPAIHACVDDWINEIVAGLVSLNYLWNPPLMVLGGGIMSEPYVLDEIRRRLPDQVMPNYRAVEIRAAKLQNLAGSYGAYCSVRQKVL